MSQFQRQKKGKIRSFGKSFFKKEILNVTFCFTNPNGEKMAKIKVDVLRRNFSRRKYFYCARLICCNRVWAAKCAFEIICSTPPFSLLCLSPWETSHFSTFEMYRLRKCNWNVSSNTTRYTATRLRSEAGNGRIRHKILILYLLIIRIQLFSLNIDHLTDKESLNTF